MPRSDFWFAHPFRVRYAEIDGQNIVFNAHYLTYFDTAITEYMRAIDYNYYAQQTHTGTDFHTVRALVEYKAPIRFDEEIEVCVRVAKLGRSSATFHLEIHSKDQEDLRATGEIVWVNADQKLGKSAPLPEAFIERIRERETNLH